MDDAPAWYGKLACLGDFAGRRLPQAAIGAIDAWLAQGIAASRQQLGEPWLSVYLTSPLWRFAWAPGVLDASWWFGLMMPSVDNVGRYFPLVVLHSCREPPCDAERLTRLEQWYERIEQAVLRTLQASTLDAFEAELAQAGPPAAPCSAIEAAPSLAGSWSDRTRYEIPAQSTLAQGLRQLATADALRRLQGCTLWWARRADDEKATSLSFAMGLPPAGSFAALLQGTW